LVVDLSNKQIRITTGFTGTSLLLFGATDAAGDVVVVVRGPRHQVVVRRKERVAGIWVNGSAQSFNSVPGYYFVASSRPLKDITDEATLDRLQIGVHRLRLSTTRPAPPGWVNKFRVGLVNLKKTQGLFSASPERVSIVGDRLFRADLTFPANVPTGAYTADVYLFRNGQMVVSSKTTLAVRKAGLEATIFDFAHQHSAIYGIIAILIALFAGWLAGAIFRKV
ncbi:MAG: TIGR02186 family protein, partial [Rhodospirillaceae bacterium]|nr:TIGR02186 family protein [Rhodospirillaceae bacterium]